MTEDKIREYIEKNLSQKRYEHSLLVAKEGERLAVKYGENPEKAYLAGLIHDCAKELDEEDVIYRFKKYKREDVLKRYTNQLLHGPLAALMMQYEFEIDDDEIFDAVWYHTTGKEDMPTLSKIIYLADFIEPNREFDGVEEVRTLAEESLDKAILKASEIVVVSTVKRGLITDIDTVLLRNSLLKKTKKQKIDFLI